MMKPQWEAVLLEAERQGILEKVRDKDGNVMMKPGADGKPQTMWRRTAKDAAALH